MGLKNLIAAPPLKVHHFRIKFNDEKARQLSPEDRKAAMKFLDNLIFIKRQAEHLTLTVNLLSKSVPAISAYDLLKAMFIVVQVQMSQKRFGLATSRK